MTKKDLKTGMLVQYKDGSIRMVIKNYLVGENGYLDLEDISYNLLYTGIGGHQESLNIIKVSEELNDHLLMPKYWTEETLNDHLLWERKEEKTIEIDGISYSETTLKSIINKFKNS